MLAAFHPVHHQNHPYRVHHYEPYENELHMEGIEYPVKLKQVQKVERQNSISINVFGLVDNGLCPIYITKTDTIV